MTILRAWLQQCSQLILTTTIFALAAGVSVLVNVLTEGWAWPVGIGVVVLVACQVVVERVRAGIADPGFHPRQRSTVDQTFGEVRDSEVSGINRASPGGDAEVRQHFEDVHNSRITGLDEGDRS
ncbi:hypothetical protein [Umezawaea sp.]|uniref:hypothetical protein n=1 Tax=Umezawaea sp. TaxID=1955258 RepID=UPI002ED2957D